MTAAMKHIGVIGSGAWGTALAQVSAQAGHRVTILSRDEATAEEINGMGTNGKYLPDIALHARISATLNPTALSECDLLILGVPAQQTRIVLEELYGNSFDPDVAVIASAKGFERQTLRLQTEIISDIWTRAKPLILSGPSFAVDAARGRPTAVTLAGLHAPSVAFACQTLASESFRPYASADPIGVQIAGGLKNVFALAAGAVEGAELGLSARSALIGRAHAEMVRLILAKQGQNATANGLAGLGDLVLSCTSAQSRNYAFGLRLGQGLGKSDIQAQGLGLAEGVLTAPVAGEMAHQAGVEMPLVEAINLVLNEKMTILDVVNLLMTRPLKSEG